jgi:hypothetical protein
MSFLFSSDENRNLTLFFKSDHISVKNITVDWQSNLLGLNKCQKRLILDED